ncbi:Amino-acid transporter arg-13 [Leucoagaricus sp. SymC.cos]|nr:Amino-acid transporter arg-13 [Leucoagaricus sp. SymC.cos]
MYQVAGMVAEIFEYPFDLAKVRLQAQLLHAVDEGSSLAFKGPLHCFTQTWRKEGLRGLYRGVSVPLMGSMAETAGLFLAYSSFQQAIQGYQHGTTHFEVHKKPPLTIPQLGLAAAGAGFVASFILTPVELIKCKMQVQMMNIHSQVSRHQSQPLGSLTIVRSIFQDYGFKGFWLGQTGTILRDTGGTALWFVAKEVVADALKTRRYRMLAGEYPGTPSFSTTSLHKMEILPWESAISGATAGAAATLLFYPADTVKSAVQTEQELNTSSRRARNARPTTFWRAALKMYRAHGLKCFYAGCGMTVARSVPSSGIIFVVYDGLRQCFG